MKKFKIKNLPLTLELTEAKSYMLIHVPTDNKPAKEVFKYLSGEMDAYIKEHEHEYTIQQHLRDIFIQQESNSLTGSYLIKYYILCLNCDKDAVLKSIEEGTFHQHIIRAIDYDSLVVSNMWKNTLSKKVKTLFINEALQCKDDNFNLNENHTHKFTNSKI